MIFQLAGVVSILAGCTPSKFAITRQLVVSIIATCFCIPQLVCSGLAVVQIRDQDSYYEQHRNYHTETAMTTMYSIQILIGILVAFTSIILSNLACRAVCWKYVGNDAVYYRSLNSNTESGDVFADGILDTSKN